MSSDGSVIAATSAGGAPYFSVDSGASWTFLGTAAGYKAAALSRDGRVWYGLVGNTGTVHKVVLDNRFTLVAGTQGGDIIRSTDGGVSWAHVTKPSGSLSIQGGGAASSTVFLAADATQGKVLLSADGGATFSDTTLPDTGYS